MDDAQRLSIGVRGIVGKRLTHKQLIGKTRIQEAETPF
jgi:hypothetical protein